MNEVDSDLIDHVRERHLLRAGEGIVVPTVRAGVVDGLDGRNTQQEFGIVVADVWRQAS